MPGLLLLVLLLWHITLLFSGMLKLLKFVMGQYVGYLKFLGRVVHCRRLGFFPWKCADPFRLHMGLFDK